MTQKTKSMKHDLAFSFSARGILILKGIISQILIARFLEVDGRGSFAVCVGFTTILMTLFVVGCDIAAIYFVSSRKFTLSEGVSYTFVVGCMATFLACTVGFLLTHLPIAYFSKAPKEAFYIALLSIPSYLFIRAYTQLLTASDDFRGFALFSLLSGLLHLIFIGMLLGLFHGGVASALLAAILSEVIVVIAILIYMKIKFQIRWVNPNWNKIGQMLSYGVRHYFGRLSNLANTQVGIILVTFFCNETEIGLFSVAGMMAAKIMIIPDTFRFALMPRASASQEGGCQLIARLTRMMTAFSFVLCLLIICFAKIIIVTLFGEEYQYSAFLLQILSVGYCLRSVSKLSEPYFLGTGRPQIPSISVFVGIIVNLIMLIILLPRVGIAAAAVGTVSSFIVSSIILFWIFLANTKIHLRSMLVIHKADIKYLKSLWTKKINQSIG